MNKLIKKVVFLCTSLLSLSLATSSNAANKVRAETSTYTYTFEEKVYDRNNQSKELGEVFWTFSGKSSGTASFGFDEDAGQEFGASTSKYFKSFTLTSDSDFLNISNISINTVGGSLVKLDISVGGTSYYNGAIGSSLTDYSVDLSSPASGAVSFSFSQTSRKVISIKSISITYGEENGATGGEGNDEVTYDEVEVNDRLNLNAQNIDALSSKYQNIVFTSEDVSYQATQLEIFNDTLYFNKATENSGLYNLNPYSKSIKRVLVEKSSSYGSFDVYGVSSLDSLKDENNKATQSTVEIQNNNGEFIEVLQYEMTGEYQHFNLVSTYSYETNLNSIWVEFADRYTVNFDKNTGLSSDTTSYYLLSGEKVKAPSVSRNGYVFNVWLYNNELIKAGDEVVATSNATYLAQWDKELANTKVSLEFSFTKGFGESNDVAFTLPSSYTSMYPGSDYASKFGVQSSFEVFVNKYSGYSNTTATSSSIALKSAASGATYGSSFGVSTLNGYSITSVELTMEQDEQYAYVEVLDSSDIRRDATQLITFSSPVTSVEFINKSTNYAYITGLKVTYATTTYDNFDNMSIGLFADYTKVQVEDYKNISSAGFLTSNSSNLNELSQGMSLKDFESLNSSSYKKINVDQSYWNQDNGLSFSAKIANIPSLKWSQEFTFVSYIVDGDKVYFANEKNCSVLSLAQEYLDKNTEDVILSNEQEAILIALLNK